MEVLKTNFYGNPNLGLYGFATDKYCLIGRGLSEEIIEEIEQVLGVKVYEITVNHSRLIGSYCCGNNKLILVPSIIKEGEEEELKKLKIPYKKIKSKFCALGNNIILRDDVALINPEFEKNIEEELKEFKLKRMNIGDHNAIGSCIIANKNGCLVSVNVTEEELKEISKTLGLKAEIGSVNRGSPYVKAGLIANSKGYLMGDSTTGVEGMRIEMALG
ncbi:MAG: translation initiation factor IF-6 [Nanoarchaeota archaeon]|nr:translation initiation factor IF-6 [Nanoarchaeota archaeon]